jgi:outer membrane protein OmpA-like peptidoglycan-associated protein
MKQQTAQRRQEPISSAPKGAVLQRTCSCGQQTHGDGKCTACSKDSTSAQDVRAAVTVGSSSKEFRTATNAAWGCTNSAVVDFSRIPSRMQRKPTVGPADDRYEQEADRIADEVIKSSVGSRPLSGELRRPLLQRACKKCEEKLVQRKNTGATATAAAFDSGALDSLSGGGQPLSPSQRSFFEGRMGHDFGRVRVHSDARADRLARSIQARAFTYRNDIVLRQDESLNESERSRHLLAHELTHTIQQGASPSIDGVGSGGGQSVNGLPAIQRRGDVTKVPGDMLCPIGVDAPGSSATSVLFGQDSSTILAIERPKLSAVAAAWHAGGGAGILRIDGFASTDGPDDLNWRLSCNRASAVALELEGPTDGSPGVPNTNIQVSAQGETAEFSAAALAPNRRAVITTTGGAPAPGPACGFSITGPHEVDHYCAAYVPSDAASCGVFPAPNISLAASGATAGRPVRWSIIRGTTKAAIVGANSNPTVAIQGTLKSPTRDDVTVQATDGLCTATHLLTVREPSQMTASQVPTITPNFVQALVTYTVKDQFGSAMGANICVDETVTVCKNINVGTVSFHDAATNAAGQVSDNLALGPVATGLPANICLKLDQTITAGGCGPLLHNTILMQASGITLTFGGGCAVGDACP